MLFIDEIHTVIGAGATSGGAMDASNLLKPALQGGKLRCMGSTTYKEFRQHFEKDRALSRRFQKIDVNEPSVEDAVKILKGSSRISRITTTVAYTPTRSHSGGTGARYINDRKLPDKAIDVIDEAGAAQHLVSARKRRKTIGVKEIEAVVAKIARIPPKNVRRTTRSAARSGDIAETRGVRSGQGDRGAGQCHQTGPCRSARTGKAHRQLLCSQARPASARPRLPSNWPIPGRRNAALRHVRIYGEARRFAPDWRASRLCRV